MSINTLELSKKLFERYEQVHKRIDNYFGLLALYGFSQTAYEIKDEALIKKCVDMLKMYPDKISHPHYNFECYKIGGNAKVWLAEKGYFQDEKELIREYAEKTLCAPKSKEGILCMPSDKENNKIWIDTVHAVTPFMLYAGLLLGEEKYIDFAAEQCFLMYEFFLDKTCGLLHQSRGFMEDKTLVSADHWSRGNGWCYMGLADLVLSLPKNSPHMEKAKKYFKDLSKAILNYRDEKGVWRQELTNEYSWAESSGTAIFLYGFGVGLRTGILEKETFEKPYKESINAFAESFIKTNYSTLMCCHGCLCPGEGKDRGSVKAYLTAVRPVEDERHSYGAMMLALTEAYRNGINEVTPVIE